VDSFVLGLIKAIIIIIIIIIVTDDTIKECKEKCESLTVGSWKMKNVTPKEALVADDMVLVVEIDEKLQ
jgi:hypothetical protein